MSPRPRFDRLGPAKRDAILAAAARELADRGFSGASYNRIIERAGVSKGAMYYYFDDKRDLCLTTLRDASERAAAAIGELAPFDGAQSFWDALLDLYERTTAFFAAEPLLAALLKRLLISSHDEEVEALIRAYTERLRAYFEGVIERGVALAAVRDDLPTDLLASLTMAVGEATDRWLLGWETVTDDELRATAATLLSLHMRLLAPLPLIQQREARNASAEGARSEAAPSEVQNASVEGARSGAAPSEAQSKESR